MDDRSQRFETMKTDMAKLRETAMKRSEALKNEVDSAVETLSKLEVSMDTRESLYSRFTSVETLAGVAVESIKKLIEALESLAAKNLPAANGSEVSAKTAIKNLNRIIHTRA